MHSQGAQLTDTADLIADIVDSSRYSTSTNTVGVARSHANKDGVSYKSPRLDM